MATRRGASAGFNNPPTVDQSNAMIFNFALTSMPTDGDCFYPDGFNTNPSAGPASIANGNVLVMNRAGTVSLLRVQGNTNALTVTETLTLQKNGSNTTVVATTVIGSPTMQDNTHSFTVAAGDHVSIIFHLTAAENFAAIAGSFYFTPA